MKTLASFLLLACSAFAATQVNDLNITQVTKATAPIASAPRQFHTESALSDTLASFQSAVGLGVEDSPAFLDVVVNGTPLTALLDAKQDLLVDSAGLAAAIGDEVGTGFAVFNSNPTLVGYTLTGSAVITYTAMPALEVNVALPGNTKSITGDVTFTYSNNTPTAGTQTRVKITADGTNRTVTIPSTWSLARGGNITSLLVPASTTLAVMLEYTGARWEIYGDPVATTGAGSYVLADSGALTGTPTAPTAAAATNTTQLATTAFVQTAVGALFPATYTATGQTANTHINGLTLSNATPAAAVNQQYSPSLLLQGEGWRTNATAESQTVAWRLATIPVQGAASPTSTLTFDHILEGTPTTGRMLLTSAGALTAAGTITANGTTAYVVSGLNAGFQVTTRAVLLSGADGVFTMTNNAQTGFTRLNWGGATTSFSGIAQNAVNSLQVQSGAGSTTFNDASTAGSGTVASRYAFGIPTPAFSATNSSVTNTVAASFTIDGEPTAGTNVTNTASYAFYIAGGDVRWAGYGAGALTTDANGVITAASDERMKDVGSDFSRGLADIRKITPKNYHWKGGLGLDTITEYSGFIAQDVQAAIPEAVGKGADGFLTLSDRPITAALVNAVKELDTRSNTDWVARGLALAALVLAVRANLVLRRK